MKHYRQYAFLTSWPFTLCVCLLIVGVTAAVFFRPGKAGSDVYRQYVGVPGIKATYFESFPINDTLSVKVTLLEAVDSTGWRILCNDFNISLLAPELQNKIDSGKDLVVSRQVNRFDYRASVDSTCDNVELLAVSYLKRSVCIFHVTNSSEIHAVFYHNFDKSTNHE